MIAWRELAVASVTIAIAIGFSPSGRASASAGKTIVFVPGVIGNPFYVSMECGIRATAARLGLSVRVQGPQQFDPSLQIPIVNAVIATRPAGLLIAPTNSKALFSPIAQAAANGIKVVLVDTTLEDTSKVVSAIATDNIAGGAAAAQVLAELIDRKGAVMALAFQPGASTSDQRQKGFEAEIKKYPQIRYVGYQITNNDPARAAAQVGASLAAHPDLSGIFANNDRGAQGAATGLRNTMKVGAVKLVGFDATQFKQVQNGTIDALIAQRPFQIGVDGVLAIDRALNGQAVVARQTTGTVTITKENLSQPEIQNALYVDQCAGSKR